MKKLALIIASLLSISLSANSMENYTIPTEITLLTQRIDHKSNLTLCDSALPYAGIVLTGLVVTASQDKLPALVCSLVTYGIVKAFLVGAISMESWKAQKLFKFLASHTISPNGELIPHHHSNFPFVLNNEQFVYLGLKAGFSELDLIDLAKTLGRLEIAYKLKHITSSKI